MEVVLVAVRRDRFTIRIVRNQAPEASGITAVTEKRQIGVCPCQAFPTMSNVCGRGWEPTLEWMCEENEKFRFAFKKRLSCVNNGGFKLDRCLLLN